LQQNFNSYKIRRLLPLGRQIGRMKAIYTTNIDFYRFEIGAGSLFNRTSHETEKLIEDRAD